MFELISIPSQACASKYSIWAEAVYAQRLGHSVLRLG